MCKLQQKSIRLNDILLTVYLAILLVHLVLSLVFPLPQNDEGRAIDVVLRTVVAAPGGVYHIPVAENLHIVPGVIPSSVRSGISFQPDSGKL